MKSGIFRALQGCIDVSVVSAQPYIDPFITKCLEFPNLIFVVSTVNFPPHFPVTA